MKKILFYSVFLLSCSAAGAYDKIEFKSQITNPGFLKPSAVVTSEGRVFVADSKANAVFIFDSQGKLLNKTKAPLEGPAGLSFGNGKLYVAESGASRITVLDGEGTALWSFSGSGSAPGQLDSPMGVAFGPDMRVYVADTGNSRVEVFSADGIFLYGFPTFKSDNRKINPWKIVIDRAGFIYVSDPGQALIQKYDRTGKLIKEYPLANDAMAVNDYGGIYAVNGKEGKVREINPNGEVTGTFGTRGKGKSEFLKLRDITLDTAGLLYLCDEGNKKISVINLEAEQTEKKLDRAISMGRFNIKGPTNKYPFKAESFVVKPDGAIVAWLPEVREAALIDASGKKTLIRYGDAQGQVKNPRSFASDFKGKLYVADTSNDRLQIFDSSGAFISAFGEGGSKEGNFSDPSGLAVNDKGRIYIADTGNKRLQAFNADGIFLFAVGPKFGSVILQKPVAVSIDNSKNIYILDAALKKVVVTDAAGKFLKVWDNSGDLQNPVSMVYDGKGYFYILDKGASNVKLFDEDGIFTASFFAKGKGERELLDPQYLAIKGNTLYISDKESSRILAFDLDYIPEAPTGLEASAEKTNVKLSWQSKAGLWLKKFALFRTSDLDAEPKLIASPGKPAYSDPGLASGATYYYFAAGVSITGSTGEMSEPVAVFIEGPKAAKATESSESGSGSASASSGDSKNMAPVEIVPSELNYVFSANYKNYLKNPVGRVKVRNNTDTAFSNLKLSFYFKDFMDFPTDTVVPEIAPKATVTVDLMATLNNRILSITEDTPVQCQLTLTYYLDGQEKTTQINKPVKVLSKNAIVWDRTERMGNFITPKDTPVFSFSRYALLNFKKFEKEADLLNENLMKVLIVWEALGEQGLSYLSDPTNPYAALKSSGSLALDTVQFPRTTLKIKSGDCDDLTAMFASMLEANGVHTALLDYPAHIAMMFDTGASDAKEVGIPEEYLIKYNNTWWVGLETTMVGNNIYDAIVHEADLYKKAGADTKIIDTHLAWGEFEPVTMPETSDEKFDLPKLSDRVTGAVDVLMKSRYEYFKKYYGRVLLESPDDLDANMNMGILAAQYKDYNEADKRLNKVLEKDPKNAAALNNLGNISFMLEKYDEARAFYMKASKADPYDGDIWLNLARTAVKTGQKDDVKTFVDRAVKVNPELKGTADKLSK
ncbi:MAG TPA: hypothetical protein DCL44_05960 [Elusimicrobia bacterium]|nr:hypothetical protein [Elusimicrobiota bacterium]